MRKAAGACMKLRLSAKNDARCSVVWHAAPFDYLKVSYLLDTGIVPRHRRPRRGFLNATALGALALPVMCGGPGGSGYLRSAKPVEIAAKKNISNTRPAA